MPKKKKIIISVAVVLCVALVVGGVFAFLRLRRDPVNVYAVTDLAQFGGYFDENYSYGFIRTDKLQTVYLTETQQVTQMLVSEGQSVKQGDALLTFDTSLSDLQLQSKNLEIQQLERDLLHAKEDYNELAGYRYFTVSADGTQKTGLVLLCADGTARLMLTGLVNTPAVRDPADTPDPTESADPSETETPTEPTDPTDPTEPPAADSMPGEAPVDGVVSSYFCVGGSGSENKPWLYVFTDDIPFEDSFISALLVRTNEAYVVFAQTEENRVDTVVNFACGIRFTAKTDGGYQFSLFDASDYVGRTLLDPTVPDTPEDPSDPDISYDPGYSYEELQQMKAEKLQQIKELELNIRMSKLEYTQMQKELGDGTIYAEIDGVVTTVGDPETAYQQNEPVVKVSGGGGYYVDGAVSELELDSVHVGQMVSVMAWESGTMCDGTITEVSSYPSESGGYYSDSNPNVTFYGYTVEVDGSQNLMEGEYVEMTISGDGEQDDAFYLDKAFILQENGKNIVYVQGENGKLEKREIVTGKELWGSYLEVCSGLTLDDYVAFPYSKSAVDGAKTKTASLDELYQ